jgi:acyl carrier protein
MDRQEIFAVIKGNVEQIIEGARGQSIQEVHSMRDFGADSLEVVEVVGRSMKQLKIKVPRTELSAARNLGDLVDLFEKAGAGVS